MTYAPKSERLHVDKSGRPGGVDLTKGVGFNEAGQVGQAVATGPIIGGTALVAAFSSLMPAVFKPRQTAGLFFASAKNGSVYTLPCRLTYGRAKSSCVA
jgi:hypothetical protein